MKTLKEKMHECRKSRLTDWAEGREIAQGPPWLVYINPTNVCNNHCVMCPHHEIMRRDRGHMSLELFERIVGELPEGVRKVYLLKQGEPFLNRELPGMIRHIKRQRPEIHVAVHTNTTVPFGEGIREVMRDLDSLGLSVSAVRAEVYERVHGRAKFDRVLQNLDAVRNSLLDLPEEERPYVFIDYVRQSANSSESMDEVIAFYEARYPEFSSLDMHSMFNWQGAIEEANLSIYDVMPLSEFPCCVFPWSTITFCHDGKVSYCHEEARENRFLGDINTQSFEEIWNGDEYRAFRRGMVERRYDELESDGFHCRKCSYLWDVHSRSPQNLTTGYSTNLKNGHNPTRYGNLLELAPEELLAKAADYYLNGDVHKSMGILEHLQIVGCPDQLEDPMRELYELNRCVTETFKGMYVVAERMRELGETKEPTVYHKLGYGDKS